MARPTLGKSETERLHVKITADEIAAIDDWRYANRIPSRSEAVRRLMQMGLRVDAEVDHVATIADKVYGLLVRRGNVVAEPLMQAGPNWKLSSKLAMGLISDLAEPATELMLRTLHLARQMKALRSMDGDLAAIARCVEESRRASEDDVRELQIGFREAEEQPK